MIVITESAKEINDVLAHINPKFPSQHVDDILENGSGVFSYVMGGHNVQVFKSDDRWEFYARKRDRAFEQATDADLDELVSKTK